MTARSTADNTHYVYLSQRAPISGDLANLPPEHRRVKAHRQPVAYALFDATGTPIYVGSTDQLRARFAEHRRRSPWWPDAMTYIALPVENRHLAFEVEALLGQRLRPRYGHITQHCGAPRTFATTYGPPAATSDAERLQRQRDAVMGLA